MQVINLASSSKGNCYLVKDNGAHILIECGLPYSELRKKLLNVGVKVTDIDCCIISHQHQDHCKCAYELANFTKVYANDEVCKKVGSKKINVIKEKETIVFKNVKITSFDVQHGATKCFGYILQSEKDTLLFATDFNICKYKFNYEFTRVMIECNYLDEMIDLSDYKVLRQINTHMGLNGCISYLKTLDLSKCSAIYLMHLSDGYSDELVMRAVVEKRLKTKTFICKKDGGVI